MLLGLVITAGCSNAATSAAVVPSATSQIATDPAGSEATETAGSTSTTAIAGTHADAGDDEWDASSEVAIALRDGGTIGGAGTAVEGDVVTINAGGTYRIGGSLSNGQIVVDTDDEDVVRLILDGVAIANTTTSPVSVVDAEKVVVILAAGSQNTLTDATDYQYPSADVDEPNAALFSTADLTITGEGSLTISGNDNDAIASKDGLIIAGGTITVTAADDGIRGKDYLVVTGGTLAVTAGGDALKADNADDAALGYVAITGGTLDLTAGTDAIDATTTAIVDNGSLTIAAGDDALHADVRLEINGGTIDIDRSYEGLEATQIVITGGDIDLVAEDDGLNVAGGNDGSIANGPGDRGGPGGGMGGETAIDGYYVEISGGTLVIDAGGDGFDSNGSATITGGTIVVSGPTSNGNGAIDVNGEFLVSDAVLLAAGSAGMAEAPSMSSAQAYLNLQFGAGQAAGTVVSIRSSDGTPIVTFVAAKPFQSLVFSSPDLGSGASYDVLTGGSVSGDGLGGLYLGVDSTDGSSIGSVTAVAG
jgi:hypothetical protein